MVRGIISPPRSRSYKEGQLRRRSTTTTPISLEELPSHENQAQSRLKRPNKNKDGSSNTSCVVDPSKSTLKTVLSRLQKTAPNSKEKKLENSPKTASQINTKSSSHINSGAKTSAIAKDTATASHYDPRVCDQLHHLSIDGKNVYESAGSETKEEKYCSQSNANNGAKIFEIYKKIVSHRHGNSSITSYFTKLKALWDELATLIDMPQCSSNSIDIKLTEHIEREKVMQFLMGLHDSYSTICSQILFMSPFPTVETAYSVFIREEKLGNWFKYFCFYFLPEEKRPYTNR